MHFRISFSELRVDKEAEDNMSEVYSEVEKEINYISPKDRKGRLPPISTKKTQHTAKVSILIDHDEHQSWATIHNASCNMYMH